MLKTWIVSLVLTMTAVAQTTRLRPAQVDWMTETAAAVREAADGTRTTFTLDAENPPIANTLKVYVNGTRNTAFTYNASTRVITFSSAPANAASVIVDLETTRGTATHRRLGSVRRLLNDSESVRVTWLNHGDSRGAWRHWRHPGAFFRQFNVKHAALVVPGGVESANGTRDGLGNFLVGGLTGISNDAAAPGETLVNSTIANIFPYDISEAWVTGAVSNPNFGRYSIQYSTSGGAMDSTSADASTGGVFARGDPALSRNIASLTRYLITDTRPSAWASTYFEFGYNASESGAGSSSGLTPLLAPSGLAVTAQSITVGNSTGTQITSRHRFLSSTPSLNTGVVTLATRIDFAGASGVVFGSIAQGGWQTSDFESPSLNADGKFTDTGYRLLVSNVFATTKGVLRFELGQNMTGGQWNGTTIGTYKADVKTVVDRAIANAVAAGMTDYAVLLVVPFRGTSDDVNRINQMRLALLQLSDENGWSVYDQQRELEDRNWATVNGSVLSSMVEDGIHQTFLGMNELGEAEYETIMSE